MCIIGIIKIIDLNKETRYSYQSLVFIHKVKFIYIRLNPNQSIIVLVFC